MDSSKNESGYEIELQSLDNRIYTVSRTDIAESKRDSKSFMPAVNATEAELQDLLAFLTRLTGKAYLASAGTNEALPDSISFTRITSPRAGEWPSYDGQLSGNRHSGLTQINRGNVSKLGARWMYNVLGARTRMYAGGDRTHHVRHAW